MPMPTELDHCPITPECSARKLYRDEETGKLYRLADGAFVEHVCSSQSPVSELPKYVFTGVWFNTRSQRTRYHGPFRLRASAKKPPPDGGKQRTRRKGEDYKDEWVLKGLLYDTCDWKPVEDSNNE